jgi:HD superfamily phosphohydrolase
MNLIVNTGYTEPVRDPLWGHVYFTPALLALTQTPAFMRLSRILQLGPASLLYPGATHTRAAHSIGVYALARRLILRLAEEADWLTPSGLQSFLCAALLHDLGHFPYAHSLKELPLPSHEALTAQIILSEPLKSLVAQAGGDPYVTAAIVDTGLPAQGARELGFYRKLLSGCLDPDKLDYLNRDARYCGVPYGAQDVDFVLRALRPHLERGVDIDSRGVPGVESLLFSKYLMYRSVYWRPVVRSATALIKKALLAGLADGVIAKEELYHLDDAGLFSLLAGRQHPLFALAASVRQGRLYPLAAAIPFDQLQHTALARIEDRLRHEEALAAALSDTLGVRVRTEDLVIDIPEPIVFETDLYIADEGRRFAESESPFTPETIAAFTSTLRVVRLFVAPERIALAEKMRPVFLRWSLSAV